MFVEAWPISGNLHTAGGVMYRKTSGDEQTSAATLVNTFQCV